MLTPERSALIESFLSAHLKSYQRAALAADASFRRYERITLPTESQTRILMDAPPPKEEVLTFSKITHTLRDARLHAPEILSSDPVQGFLLLEDLGGDSFSRHLAANPEAEWHLYRAALDVLIHLHQHRICAENLPRYDAKEYRRELEIFTHWYPEVLGNTEACEVFLALWESLLQQHAPECNQMVLRDYHADNLMWIVSASDLWRVGLLDYQDAILGDAAYDVVSLLEDARRDVAPETTEKAINYYCTKMQCDPEAFALRYALLGAQRNCKIIGIFHRLNVRDHKPHYLAFLPRVWQHLRNDLAHPVLAPLKEWMQAHIAHFE